MKFFLRSLIVLSAALISVFAACSSDNRSEPKLAEKISREKEKPRILYVDSYHPEYQWSRSIMSGLFKALGVVEDGSGRPLEDTRTVELKVLHMDTKRNSSEEFKIQAGLKVHEEIESWKPDLVICSDDNAAKYLIVPYYMESDIPFIFCGINHDAAEYGFPTSNVSGILEIHNAIELVAHLEKYTDGDRIAYLSGNNLSGRKIGYSVQKQLGAALMQVYVDSYSEWKDAYLKLQDSTDILLLETAQYFPDWDGNMRALEWFVMENTRIPTGAWDNTLSTVALMTIERTGEEQGEWAGKTALRILNGEADIADIPIAKGRRTAVYLNMMLARDLDIVFPMDLLDIAHLSNELDKVKKVLYVNSYHKGYVWSDDVEKGVIKALSRSELPIDLQIIRMDTKNYTDTASLEKKALEVKKEIAFWKPDIVIGSDDNFVRYVVVPYFENEDLPFVVCGINWDASDYGLPFSNVTGMVEVDPIREETEIMSRLSRGGRLGFLGRESYYTEKIVQFSGEELGIHYDLVLLAENFEQWKNAYLRMQKEADMLILSSPVGLKGFDREDALSFIHKNAQIPSCITVDGEIEFSLVGVSKVAEEQGWWAGSRAIEILGGRSVSDIPMTRNREIKTQLNMSLANSMGILFPPDLMEQALIWNGDTE